MTVLLACVVLVAAPSDAQDPAQKLQDAQRAYEDLDYDRVLPLLDEALALEPEPQVLKHALELKAVTHILFAEERDAERAFVRLLQLEPTYAPGNDASPKIREVFEKARISARTASELPGAPKERAWCSRWGVWAGIGGVVATSALIAVFAGPRSPEHDTRIELP